MERRAYTDKKGRVLFVRQSGGGSEPWGTHYYHPKTGVLCYLVNKALPWAKDQEAAQQNLDAYALDKELGASGMPEPTPTTEPASWR